MKRLLIVAILAANFSNYATAGAVVGATEFTQIANNVQLLAQYQEQLQQTVHQFNQYKMMLQNLEKMTPSQLLDDSAAMLWKSHNMAEAFKNLQTVVVNGQRISYTSQGQEEAFKKVHTGYSSPFDPKAYRNWSDNSHAAVVNALAVANVQSDAMVGERDMVQELQSRSRTANGQLAALQAGNDVGIAMVGQMQQLRQLQMAQMKAQNTFLAQETSVSDQAKKSVNFFLNSGGMRSTKVVRGTMPASANP
jgi:P-type conjugative transfer protein TrbJ